MGGGANSNNHAKILDVACGSRMFWFDKNHPDAIYMDNRKLQTTLCDGRILNINPDIIGDFTNIPFPNDTFYHVVFDPPHLIKVGETSWLAKKYGVLPDEWQQTIRDGFKECMRVLKPNGTLIFKWNEEQIKLGEILKVIGKEPLYGNRRSKTHWLVFMKLK
jgi:SAM-dependent methyltransferase